MQLAHSKRFEEMYKSINSSLQQFRQCLGEYQDVYRGFQEGLRDLARLMGVGMTSRIQREELAPKDDGPMEK